MNEADIRRIKAHPKVTGEYTAGKLLMLNVESSNIHSVGYDGDSETLVVRFTSHSVYAYDEVPARVALAFMEAPSHGSYFHQFIKDRYEATQIDLKQLPKSLRKSIEKEVKAADEPGTAAKKKKKKSA